jgi:hypothetical protein
VLSDQTLNELGPITPNVCVWQIQHCGMWWWGGGGGTRGPGCFGSDMEPVPVPNASPAQENNLRKGGGWLKLKQPLYF